MAQGGATERQDSRKLGRVRQFAFGGTPGEVRAHIRDTLGYTGPLLDLYCEHAGRVITKWHHYLPLYDRYFARFRGRPVRMLEIGVFKGGSLDLWRDYLGPEAVIYGIDIDPKCARFDGISGQVRIGSQDDLAFLDAVVEEMGGIDLVLDDGSHHMAHVWTTLRHLFPRLSPSGSYMIEDLHTAYWPRFGGGIEAEENLFARLRGVVDDLHFPYHVSAPRVPELKGLVGGVHIHDSVAVLDRAEQKPPVFSKVGGA
ncbi:class I SAM-dependent methyltransferase [Poseidonocella sedimentorum]|uniref:Methyltransferase domain-containing protein n=1 Tax=Poseidonocella sedimentorum TaxID=871652 RepID=A0A1I6CNK4_9RHOB|nr:class I SAM-dependent methyltransferase [Poseidonocella sedimentorum]SFQ94741.1 Methyltransferase domain-containing protein [Poseidonocella sedimentorum]